MNAPLADEVVIPRGNMHFAFVLSMPNRASWNGRWSGEDRPYVLVKSFGQRPNKERLSKLVGNHYYSFGDGWGANVEVKIVDAATSKQLRKKSAGFCGYDWMVDTLVLYGRIMNDNQKRAYLDAQKAAANG